MAYISFQPSDFFSTKIYTGDNSATQAQTGVGFQPDFTWIKCRSATEGNTLTDSVRGATKYLISNTNSVEITNTDSLKSFDSDGFTVGNAGVTGDSNTYVSWNWKGGTTTGIAGSPSITPASYSFNATSGFSVVKWAGTGSAGTLPHGLGVAPKWILVKRLEGSNWICGHDSLGWTKSMIFNEGEGVGTNTRFNDTNPTSTLFSLDGDILVNNTGSTYIAYCFADVKGYSKFGKYWGNGQSSDGTFCFTGFRPAYVMIKRFATGNPWVIYDNKRQGYNNNNDELFVNTNSAEVTTDDRFDILSNGFKPRSASQDINGSGEEYIYMSFAESPLVSSNNIPVTAR